jgi:NAD-dependent dihydropyrimidine dehydrogenase PreA subunit
VTTFAVPVPGRRLREAAVSVVETLLRMLPFPTATGLRTVGSPGPTSPVVLTGNFRLTVQRVRRALDGTDAWLLVANSRGINVWCAATGGLLTEHDVVSVLKTSRIGEQVDHREVVLPQLAATGVDGKAVHRRTGWRVVWGPVEATDLPGFLASGTRHARVPGDAAARAMRTVEFPLRRRLEMTVAWAFPLSLPTLCLVPFRPSAVLPAVGLVWVLAAVVFAGFPLYRRWLHATSRRSVGRLTLDLGPLAVVGGLWLALVGVWLGLGGPTDGPASTIGWPWLVGALVALVVLGIDLSGSTPIFKSGLQADRLLAITLDEARCTGAAFCAEVCPKDVFRIDRARRLAELALPDECVQCGACIVQCPFDALSFVGPDGSGVPPEVIREFKLNLLGERTRPLPRD